MQWWLDDTRMHCKPFHDNLWGVPGLAKVSRFGCISWIEPVEVVQGGIANMLALLCYNRSQEQRVLQHHTDTYLASPAYDNATILGEGTTCSVDTSATVLTRCSEFRVLAKRSFGD